MSFSTEINCHSVYLHWPFCPYKCHYCPFVAFASQDEHMNAYQRALKNEIIQFGHRLSTKLEVETLFLGGGTPSTCPEHLLLDMFDTLNCIADFQMNAEITIEVNPGTITQGKLAAWKQVGINRLSVGVQSLKDQVLKNLNRHQTKEQVEILMKMASPLFENISIDLIMGLPDVSFQEWQEYVRYVVQWPIKHISIYFLTIHENTPLYYGVKTNNVVLPCDDLVVDMYDWTVSYLASVGFNHYEISNFAYPGYESKHNQVYWNRKPYKAFGVGACSFDGMSRFQNTKNLILYCESEGDDQRIIEYQENLSAQDIWLEKLMLGIRQQAGVLIDDLHQELSEQQRMQFDQLVEQLILNGLVKKQNDRLYLTVRGRALENEIVLKLSSIQKYSL
jgi:oxygen-independent coproporphyrinogen III oxidase